MKYIPGLNGLRAIAAIMVVVYHWTQPFVEKAPYLKYFILNGNFGVNIFFVLSGFLITTILLKEKSKYLSESGNKKRTIINFYARRFLRIFPIYYITLFLLFLIKLPGFSGNLFFYITYTENFNIFLNSSWDSFCHTWSLAVEEQFYLIWPFFILFTSKDKLLPILFTFILIGPIFSIFQTYIMRNALNAFILTPSCFDAFGIGALLAYFYTNDSLDIIKKNVKILLPISILFFIYWHVAPTGGHFQYFKRINESVIACALILFCLSKNYVRYRNKLLENKVMYHLGLVSYGIYLFHYSIPYLYGALNVNLWGVNNQLTIFMDYLIMFLALIMFSIFSYYILEKPVLKFKSKFEY